MYCFMPPFLLHWQFWRLCNLGQQYKFFSGGLSGKHNALHPKSLSAPSSIVITNGNPISYINIQTLLQFLDHWHCKVKVLCSQPYLLLYLPITALSAIPLGTFWTTSPSPPLLTMTTAFLFFFFFFYYAYKIWICTSMNRIHVSSKEKQPRIFFS